MVSVIRPSVLKNIWDYFLIIFLLFGASLFAFRLVQEGWLGIALFGLCIISAILLFLRAKRRLSRNYWVITTERLVDIERPGLMKEELTIIEFEDIVGVQIQRSGIGASLFGLSHILIDTNDQDFLVTLHNVRHADKHIETINRAVDTYSFRREVKDGTVILKSFYKILPELPESQLVEIKNRIDNLLND